MSGQSNWWSSLATMSDEQAMWRVQMHDDHAAFAELVRRWERPLLGLCLRMTGDEQRGEDLVQETFVRVFAGRSRFQHGRKFSTWLWRVALNLCHDEARRVGRRAEFPLAEEEGAAVLEAFEPAPDQRLLEQERAGWVRAALLALPETHRAVVILREYEGLKLREIAEVLGIPEGTVKSRMADALAQLERRLKPILNQQPARPATPCEAGRERLVT